MDNVLGRLWRRISFALERLAHRDNAEPTIPPGLHSRTLTAGTYGSKGDLQHHEDGINVGAVSCVTVLDPVLTQVEASRSHEDCVGDARPKHGLGEIAPTATGAFDEPAEELDGASDAAQTRTPISQPDPELEGLRIKAAALESKVVDLSARHAEMERRMRQFEQHQYRALGEVLHECLRLRRQYLHLQALRSGTPEDRDAECAAADEFDAYQHARDEAGESVPALDPELRDELKRLYRTAAMRCHPDRVADEDKPAAHEFFLRIQEAYRRSDVETLRLINRQLVQQADFVEPALTATGMHALERIICELQIKAADLILAIQTLQLDAAYRRAARPDDWDDYFTGARKQFEAECDELRVRIEALSTI